MSLRCVEVTKTDTCMYIYVLFMHFRCRCCHVMGSEFWTHLIALWQATIDRWCRVSRATSTVNRNWPIGCVSLDVVSIGTKHWVHHHLVPRAPLSWDFRLPIPQGRYCLLWRFLQI